VFEEDIERSKVVVVSGRKWSPERSSLLRERNADNGSDRDACFL
jgi:hypothetical protein